MTVSGVHAFTLNMSQLITEAVELTGTHDIGQAVASEIVDSCKTTLNLYAKSWQAKGLFLHTYAPAILPLTVDQQSYLLGPDGDATEIDGQTPIIRPLKITDVRLENNGVETPIGKISLTEYNELTNKDASSQPIKYAFDPQLDNAVLYVWPVALNTGLNILFKYQKPVDDFTGSDDTATMPVDWLECFTLGLAYKIAPKLHVSLDKQTGLKTRYEEALRDLDDFEETSIYFAPTRRR